MILVTCATGNLGQATIDFLQKKSGAGNIAALVRDSQKAAGLKAKGVEIRQGDFLKPDTLLTAFQGVKTLAFISSGSLEDRFTQHKNVIDAAKSAGVERIVYTSILNPSPDAHFTPTIDHFKTENYLRESGTTYTIMRNTFYFEVLPWFIGDAVASGKVYFAAGDGKACLASRIDMAEALANVLDGTGHDNNIYDIATKEAYGFSDIAATLGEAAGKQIDYISISEEAMKEALQKIGLDEMTIGMSLAVAATFKHNELNVPSNHLEELLGRKPLPLIDYCRSLVAANNA